MVKKLLCGATLAMAAIMLFAGCGAGKISDVKTAERFSDCFATKAERNLKTLDLNGYSYIKSRGDAAFFEKENGLAKTDYAVYYSGADRLLKLESSADKEWSGADLSAVKSANGRTFSALKIECVGNGKTEYRFYDGRGEFFAAADKNEYGVRGERYFYCDGDYYLVKNDGAFLKTELYDVPAADVLSDSYGAKVATDYFGNRGVYVFDRVSGKTLYSHSFNPETSKWYCAFTADEKLLLQEEIKESPVASKYTYLNADNEKFTVKTRLVTIGGGIKEETLKYPFLIHSLVNDMNDYGFGSVYDCENVATVYPIENYRIADKAHARVVIGKDGKASRRIDDMTDGFVSAKPLGKGKWLVFTNTGEARVMTDDKKVLSVFSETNLRSARFAEAGGILYDLLKGEKIDLKKEGYKCREENGIVAALENSDGEIFVYDGELKKTENYVGLWDLGYYTEKDGKYRYYTDKQALESYGKIENYLAAENDVIVIYKVSATENGYACIKNFYA